LTLHDSVPLLIELPPDDVAAEVCLDQQSCRLLDHALLPVVVGPGDESFYCRLDQDESVSHPLVLESGFEPAENSLDVHNEVVLGYLQHSVGVPPLVRVHGDQVLDDLAEQIMAHEARVVDPGVGELVTEHLFVPCVERVFTCNDLVHCDSECPHVRGSPIPLQVDHLRCPVDERVGHRLCYQYFAKELMSVPGCVKFDFAKLAQECRIVALNIYGARLD